MKLPVEPDDMDVRELTADLIALAGRRARSVAVALVDLAASPNARFAFIDSDLETRLEIGSITKALTGMLLADAIDRGGVSLDTTIAALLPNGPGEEFESISLRELCTHTSGCGEVWRYVHVGAGSASCLASWPHQTVPHA